MDECPNDEAREHVELTFLFTDIEGSSQLWETEPERMRAALALHDALLRRAIEQHNGTIVKSLGDGFHGTFRESSDAVRAAVAGQAALASATWPTRIPLRARMGLHAGRAEARDGDYFGTTVNRTARIVAVAHARQILLSEAVYQSCSSVAFPGGEVDFREIGQIRLRDIPDPERLYFVLHPALPSDYPPIASQAPVPNNLPLPTSTFVGRRKETDCVRDVLRTARLLTLVGPGGTGKTRLSVESASGLLDRYPHGIWFVELAVLADGALVPRALADILGVAESGAEPILSTIVREIRERRMLIILDNCEHLIAACAALASAVLSQCPQVQILASSREPLAISGEQTYPVPPLSVPAPGSDITAHAILRHEASRLFVDRAALIRPSFNATDGNAKAIASICTRLDGIPLAIELAAARVRVLTVEEIDARLDDRFRLLTGGSRDVLPRQQTLRALLDWSWDLLGPSEKALLARLSVFAGGFDVPSAEAVCSGDGLVEFDILDVLAALVDKSLVVRDQQGERSRYRLLETVRDYAATRLKEFGAYSLLSDRHTRYFADFVERARLNSESPDQAAWLRRLEDETGNCRAAMDWCLRQADISADAAQLGLEFAGSLRHYWLRRGHFAEGLDRTRAILQVRHAGANTPARADALRTVGVLSRMTGDYPLARASLEESLVVFQSLGETGSVAKVLTSLGNIAQTDGAYDDAQRRYQESLEISRSRNDEQGIANALGALGYATYCAGDYEAAIRYNDEAIGRLRKLGDVGALARVLGNQGCALQALREFGRAQALLIEALRFDLQIDDHWAIANSLDSIAGLFVDIEEWRAAAALSGACAALYAGLGIPQSPVNRARFDERCRRIGDRLGEADFHSAFDAGAQSQMSDLVSLAESPHGTIGLANTAPG